MQGPFFTKHALEKFEILGNHGFVVSKEEILECIADPNDIDDESRTPLIVVTKRFDGGRFLRVVYKMVEGIMYIITFYPIK